MDRFDEEAEKMFDPIYGHPGWNEIAAWGRKLYAEAHAAGAKEAEAKLSAEKAKLEAALRAEPEQGFKEVEFRLVRP